jgi:hypothetical protein
LESIPGLHKRLKIRALMIKPHSRVRFNFGGETPWQTGNIN